MSDLSFLLNEAAPPESTEDPDGQYLLNVEHALQAINHLIEAFRFGPRNQGILAGIGAQLQEIEQAYWDLYNAFDGDTATGDQLDLLGKLVGELRQGRTDDDYRAAVKVRIMVNVSDGSLPTLLRISLAMVPGATVIMSESAPMTITIDFSTEGDTTIRTLKQMLQKAKAGGVRLFISAGGGVIGSEDDDPLGADIGSEDDSPLGFEIGSEV